ncbi:MAG: MFS transporter [Bdellovibrionales bacterium]|nr:MFS transporter [Bdellovibrionales bacterium]
MIAFIHSRLAPFKHLSFRRYFMVQTLSMIGTWSHDLARAWIIVEMMGKAAALGLMLLAVALPTFLLILQGGVIVDKLEVRRVMFTTKAILACSAIALAAITEFGHIELWHLLVFGILEGLVMAFDSPAEQAIRYRLVPREDFQQAITLASSNFHLARMMGPLVAGALMAHHGPSLVFLVDGVSYLGVLIALTNLPLQPPPRRSKSTDEGSLPALFEGFQYLLKTPNLRYPMYQLLLTICLILPQIVVVFRTFVREKFHLTSGEFGYVFSLPALGALTGALLYALWKPHKPINTLRVSIPALLLSYLLVPLAPTIQLTSMIMAVGGLFSYLTFASLTITIHLAVSEEFRGRIGSLIGLGFLAIGPMMSFPMGAMADALGFAPTVWALSALFGALSAWLAFRHWLVVRASTNP